MDTTQWNPGSLLALSGSYWQTFTLHTGVKLDLFTQLDQDTLSADEMADRLDADPRGMAMLLNALAAMQLIDKEDQRYSATEPALKFLSRRSPAYIGHMIMHHHYLTDSWRRMDEAVRSGQPLGLRVTDEDERRREAFLMGMYNLASQQAPEIAAALDLEDRKHLLDLGGGPGTYAIYFCKHYPALTADVLDLATTRKYAQKTIAEHALEGRIDFIEGDFVKEEITGTYDAVWISHILHSEGPDICQQIIRKAASVLETDGMLLAHDFILEDSMDKPLFPALFALNMLQATPHGQTYSERQIRDMFSNAGIHRIERPDYRGPTESNHTTSV